MLRSSAVFVVIVAHLVQVGSNFAEVVDGVDHGADRVEHFLAVVLDRLIRIRVVDVLVGHARSLPPHWLDFLVLN